jgi:hypothetical protein
MQYNSMFRVKLNIHFVNIKFDPERNEVEPHIQGTKETCFYPEYP